MSDRPDISPEDGADAAEYVLGLMDPGARAAFVRRLEAEAALSEEVALWERYLAQMAVTEVADAVPPDRVWRRIETAIGLPQESALARRLATWRAVAIAALGTLAVAGVAGVAIILPMLVPVEPTIEPAGGLRMSHLGPTEGSDLGLGATLDPQGTLYVRRVAGGVSPGRTQQLWVLAGDGAPVSVGLLSDEPLTTLVPPEEARVLIDAGAALAVSDEPPGGSPTGAPTGDILAIGPIFDL